MGDTIIRVLVPLVVLVAVMIIALSSRRTRRRAARAALKPLEPTPNAEEAIDRFERFGYVTTDDAEELDNVMAYARSLHIPTWTILEEETGSVTIQKRAWGTLEGFG